MEGCWQLMVEFHNKLSPFLSGVLKNVICKVYHGQLLIDILTADELCAPSLDDLFCLLHGELCTD